MSFRKEIKYLVTLILVILIWLGIANEWYAWLCNTPFMKVSVQK